MSLLNGEMGFIVQNIECPYSKSNLIVFENVSIIKLNHPNDVTSILH